MSLCDSCLQTAPIPTCAEKLFIGLMPGNADQNMFVYVRDVTTGRLKQFQNITESDTTLWIDISLFEFIPNHSYEIWATLSSAQMMDRENITVETDTSCCVYTRAERVDFVPDINGDPSPITEVYLKLAKDCVAS